MDQKGHFVVDEVVAPSLLVASLYKERKDDCVILCNNLYGAEKVYEFLLSFFDEKELVFFPSDELLRAETLTSSHEFLSQRLYGLGQLLNGKKHILITHPSALLRFEPDPNLFKNLSIHLEKSSKIRLEYIKEALVSLGYSRVNKIDQSLQFAIRGDIIDIFSVNMDRPIRIELFDDEIESIREFDLQTQSSLKELDELTILPAHDLLMDDETLSSFAIRLKEVVENDKKHSTQPELLEGNVMHDLEDLVSHNYKPSLYRYFGFAMDKAFSVLDYVNPKMIFVPDYKGFVDASELLIEEAQNYYSELVSENLLPSHLSQYMRIEQALGKRRNVIKGSKFAKSPSDIQFKTRPIIRTGTGLSGALTTLSAYVGEGRKCVIVLSEPHQYETFKKTLIDAKYDFEETVGLDLGSKPLILTMGQLNEGFEIPDKHISFLASNDLFGKRIASTRFTSRFKNATILKGYEELKPGDYVVHETHGIGQFIKISTIEYKEGFHRDYLTIAYAGNGKLQVPLEQFRLVRKYSGREGAAPRLSHLDGKDWTRKKAQIKEKVNDLADRLLDLYGKRTRLEGYAFPPDDEFQKQFENDFPYQLTRDQKICLDEIKIDMESPEIMDRLLCGDVGFGKTELAFRAAFKAILAGKQAALLCPTTLLARQHYELALARFSEYGVRIALFSRLVPESIQKENIKKVISGECQFVIGTHRLLSKEIVFKDLGLLIVDEEQRFGVEQKEKIKELKNSVDVLTLSATPIPRTLQMSLVGIRPMSEINTPPENRSPIQTYVTPYKRENVFELMRRELSRNGQVFYVHNKIMGIYERASEIAENVPGAQVGVVHGRMDKDQIEDVMSKFYDGTIDILVATSVVENGIDVPNANMIIVEDADTLGLSQLYQIKGRVGRGNRIAYAYLMYNPYKKMTEDATKRLRAIQEFTELGSGYKIAQRDLMIRGAGDILGPEQAGFIDTIGLELYLKMLNEAIEEKRSGIIHEPPKPGKMFNIDAFIPDDYASPSDKIEIYQSLQECKTAKELREFKAHLKDVYGKFPEQVKLLLKKKNIDLILENEEFSEILNQPDTFDFFMSDKFTSFNGIAPDLFEKLLPYFKVIKVTYLQRRLRIRLLKDKDWLSTLESVLECVHALYCTHKEIGV